MSLIPHPTMVLKQNKTTKNGSKFPISNIGYGVLHTTNNCLLSINNILHILKASANLLSIQKSCNDNSVYIEYHSNSFFIKECATRKILLQGTSKNGLSYDKSLSA